VLGSAAKYANRSPGNFRLGTYLLLTAFLKNSILFKYLTIQSFGYLSANLGLPDMAMKNSHQNVSLFKPPEDLFHLGGFCFA
jgi:hypothetical protein